MSFGNYLKPRLFSLPVYTIMGGYDPVNQSGLIYPAARGNWGYLICRKPTRVVQLQIVG
nr:TagA domain-containing protein [Acinetobacter sp. ANC 4654]